MFARSEGEARAIFGDAPFKELKLLIQLKFKR